MNYRIVGCIPAGRRRYMRVLVPHLLAARHMFDHIQVWVNTNDAEDVAYLYALERLYPRLFRLILPQQVGTKPPEKDDYVIGNICPFWWAVMDLGTLYVRFDDDIVWLAPDAIETLIEHRLAHPEPFLVFGNIINNAFCSYIHQRQGCIPLSAGLVTPDAHCTVGWQKPEFAEVAHRCFLERLKVQHQDTKSTKDHEGIENRKGKIENEDGIEAYRFKRWILPTYQRVCINVIAFFGKDFTREDPVRMKGEEETWVTCVRPRELKRPNEICGEALFSHFAFYPQRQHLDKTDILERYRRLAPVVSGQWPVVSGGREEKGLAADERVASSPEQPPAMASPALDGVWHV